MTVIQDRETTDPRLHLTIDPQARTMISAQMSLPYLAGCRSPSGAPRLRSRTAAHSHRPNSVP